MLLNPKNDRVSDHLCSAPALCGAEVKKKGSLKKREGLSDDNSELVPPDTMPNSEVKQFSADGSVGFPHVRVGHRQALI